MASRLSLILSYLLLVYASLVYYPRWRKEATEAVIAWDVAGYYSYLPAIFIYHDLRHLAFQQGILDKYHPATDLQHGFTDPQSGNFVMKYSSGMALMYLPFFTVAHLLARPLGYPADGFSPPYQLAIQLGGLLMSLLGLWLLRRFLKYYYEDKVVALVLLLLVFGSNYLNWAAIDVGLSHTWLFTLYALLLLLTRRFYLRPTYGAAVGIGLLVGLAGLTRPTDLLSCLIPLLWGMERLSFRAIREKLGFLRRQLPELLLAAAAALLLLSVQLAYWKYVTGHWLVYSYGDQTFSFRNPHFEDYTLDYTTGWLIYAPIMVFAVFGIIPFLRSGSNKVMILAFALLNYYIVASWDVWTYGSRAMIQSYPVLSVLLAAFIAAALRRKWLLAAATPFFLLFIYHNFWFTWFAHPGSLWPGGKKQTAGLYDATGMTRQYFRRVVGRWEPPVPDVWKLKDTRHIFEGNPRQPDLLFQRNFEQDTSGMVEQPAGSSHWLVVDSAHPESPRYGFRVKDRSARWLRASAVFQGTNKEWDIWSMATWHLQLWSKGRPVREEAIRLHRDLDDWATKTIWIDAKLQPQEADSAVVWLNAGRTGRRLLMDDVRVWSFRE